MGLTVQDLLDIIEGIAPAGLAEEWDNVGLMIGSPSAPVKKILIGLDPTLDLLEEAASCGANLLITHHPFIFHPLKSVHLGSPDGRFVEQAIRKGINVISCHTNLDSAPEGVSHSLAGKLGLEDIHPLVANPVAENCGLGSIGRYRQGISSADFVGRLREACNPPWLLATANRPEVVERAAVCGGSCSELARTALEMGAQVFVTAEVKHSVARWAEQAGLWLIDAGHFATENQALKGFAGRLAGDLARQSMAVDIDIATQQVAPLQLV